MRSCLATMLALCCLSSPAPISAAIEQAGRTGPPVPFEDVGACPFEGCTYREWTANVTVAARVSRSRTAPIVFRVRAGEKVQAITGVVVTVRPTRIQFREPVTVGAFPEDVQVKPGETLYFLTYQGEGVWNGWFKGQMLTGIEAFDFMHSGCDDAPAKCHGRTVQRGETDWWVQIRNSAGLVGWVLEAGRFDCKDALGDPC